MSLDSDILIIGVIDFMNICIITTENRRLYPAFVYNIEDSDHKDPIGDINDIYDLLYKRQSIQVISNQYDEYGAELRIFHGELEKADIKTLFIVNEEKNHIDLSAVMTLSEAAKKWGLSDGSTIRKAIERDKFRQDEIKQAGEVWITTYSAMERVFGTIKNEENAYIIYDDFETVYLTRLYLSFVQFTYSKTPLSKEFEEKYQYVKNIFIKALTAIRNNQKVIIKKSRNNQIREIINTESEFFLYINVFRSRRNFSPELITRLIDDLKTVPK